MESTLTINPETGKPNPLSYKEWMTMDRKAQKAFLNSLSIPEQVSFITVANEHYAKLPKAEKKALWDARVDMLKNIPNKSLAQRLELAVVKLGAKRLSLPDRPRIIGRKLSGIENPLKKLVKSPYFIG
jgi:hypothetical protein